MLFVFEVSQADRTCKTFLLLLLNEEVDTSERVALSLAYLKACLCLERLSYALSPVFSLDWFTALVEEWYAHSLELYHLSCLASLLASLIYGVLLHPRVEELVVCVAVIADLVLDEVDAGTWC